MHVMMEEHPLTFAALFEDPSIFRHLKLPPWLFPKQYVRKDQASLSELEQQRFLCAFNVLMENGTFGPLVYIHGDPSHQLHTTQRLLPWHRIYLLKFEQALRAIHPDVTLPYWDWTKPSEQAIPPWLVSVTPTGTTPTQTIPVTRAPGTATDLAMIASNVPTIMRSEERRVGKECRL